MKRRHQRGPYRGKKNKLKYEETLLGRTSSIGKKCKIHARSGAGLIYWWEKHRRGNTKKEEYRWQFKKWIDNAQRKRRRMVNGGVWGGGAGTSTGARTKKSNQKKKWAQSLKREPWK